MVNGITKISAVVLLIGIMLLAAPAMAETEKSADVSQLLSPSADYAKMFGVLGGLLGAGIIVFGAAMGIGRIAGSATEAIARQPEAGGRIFTSMVIAASLIEGIAFFGLIVCFVAIFLLI